METKNKIKTKKAQLFSTDLIVVVVILLFGGLFLVMNQINNEKSGPTLEQRYEVAQEESKLVVTNLKTSEVITPDNKVNVDKLILLDEEQIREELNLKNKFCIVFEKDGKLVKIDPNSEINGIGSSDIVVNGIPCKEIKYEKSPNLFI